MASNLFHHSCSPWLPFRFSAHDYIVIALVAVFIVSFANARLPIPGAAVEGRIWFFAGTTFGLYLLRLRFLNFIGRPTSSGP